jgi:formylglycine-generating enzyme required for sulfatase activity
MMSIFLLPLVAGGPVAPLQGRPKATPPPGMVLVEGGPTKIGVPVKEVEAIAEQSERMFLIQIKETPLHESRVDDFFMMVNEVTNEQYLAFVQATGHRPPQNWAAAVIDAAQKEYLDEQEARRRAAQAVGDPIPDRPPFDRGLWWRNNWQGKPWAVPKGIETRPVVYVDYGDAQAYARWAGVRLPTEFEVQRAGRGKTANPYPWGTDPDDKKAVTSAMHINAPLPVGSMIEGATSQGIHDLSGNVWEWTASPFLAYPGYKDISVPVGKGAQRRKLDAITTWDGNKRVVVSGCFQEPLLAARLTTRRATERFQQTDSLGFRCAASIQPGLDMARTVFEQDLPPDLRPPEVVFDETKVAAADQWAWSPGTATVASKAEDGAASRAPLPNYAVITKYDYLLFFPAMEIEAVGVSNLRDVSVERGAIYLGAFATSRPVLEPELPRGTYLVAFRGAGVPKASAPPAPKEEPGRQGIQDGAQEPAAPPAPPVPPAPIGPRFPEGFQFTADVLVFYAPDGTPVATMPAPTDIEYARPQEPKVLIADGTREISGGVDEKGKPIVIQEPVTVATLKVNSWVRVSNKGFAYGLVLKFKPGEISQAWRH